ncbi:hypothetical protein B0O99DRAFT_300270 [Bisporella sp. PMI_857]|nr:hypothetical protein B0O99DRAFT_300270 [Bisporella sp. PMI_857]
MLVFLALALIVGWSLAQRPDNATVCDYYALARYGESNNVTQAKLIENIVALAYGGPFNLPNVNPELTGIINPGFFDNETVNLKPWFDGTLASSNFNDGPTAINWLDGGGSKPFSDFLTGGTPTVIMKNTTNQFRLFNHWLVAFSHVFDCSFPIAPAQTGNTGGSPSLSLAYVHKYMDLNHTSLGHFINQLGLAAIHYGFSQQDSDTISGNLNAQYNVRCARAVQLNPSRPPQLLSLCQDESCPLAPNPDCAAYVNLKAGDSVTASGGATTILSTQTIQNSPTNTPQTPSSASTTSAATGSETSASQKDATRDDSDKLGPGAIAGIAISSVVVALMAIGLALWYFKKRSPPRLDYTPSSAYVTPAFSEGHRSTISSIHPPDSSIDPWRPPPMMQVPIAELPDIPDIPDNPSPQKSPAKFPNFLHRQKSPAKYPDYSTPQISPADPR